jgi:diguanylate cyclase (GGDEF)-like protein
MDASERRAEAVRLSIRGGVNGCAAPLAGSLAYVMVLGERISSAGRWWFVAANLVATLLVLASAVAYGRISARRLVTTWPARHWIVGWAGLAWGSMAVLARPDAIGDQAIMLLFGSAGLLAALSWMDGWSYYLAYVIPLMTQLLTSVALGGTGRHYALAFGVVVYNLFAACMQHVVYGRVQLIDHLNDELESQRGELATANAALVRSLDRSERQARTDPLTGLANRRALLDHIDELLERGTPFSLLFLDLDRFKVVNDSVGHAAGDAVLVTVAERVIAQVAERGIPARLGGDEFAVLVPGNESIARDLGARLRAVLAEPFVVDGRQWRLGASIGMAVAARSDQPELLLRRADSAMYDAKNRGRGQLVVFDQVEADLLAHRADLAVELRRALAAGEIEAWFQPEVELATGRIVGAEVLARWRHPTLGTVAASSFIHDSLDADIVMSIADITGRAAVQARTALARAGAPDSLVFRLNAQPSNVLGTAGAERLLALLATEGCKPSWIAIELTEQTAVAHSRETTSALSLLRSAGICVALDDFGTGQSSLSTLQWLDIDDLKLDISFVRSIVEDERNAALVRGLVGLARELGLGVIAEGVESDAICQRLVDFGVERGQGFRYSPAVPFDDLCELLGVDVSQSPPGVAAASAATG